MRKAEREIVIDREALAEALVLLEDWAYTQSDAGYALVAVMARWLRRAIYTEAPLRVPADLLQVLVVIATGHERDDVECWYTERGIDRDASPSQQARQRMRQRRHFEKCWKTLERFREQLAIHWAVYPPPMVTLVPAEVETE